MDSQKVVTPVLFLVPARRTQRTRSA